MTPFEAKKLADSGRIKVRPGWDNIKIAVMTDLVSQKVCQFSRAEGDAACNRRCRAGRGQSLGGIVSGVFAPVLGKITWEKF